MSIYLDPEIEEGNIEYKRCLIENDDYRIESLISQMIWRIKEGNGEAIYYLGIEDDGTFYNWTCKEKKLTMIIFKNIIKKANLKIIKLTKHFYKIDNKENYYMKIIIRENQIQYPEKRILLLGESGVGKTTFIANIIHSKIDESNKEARMYIFNHKHEILQKKTSSFNYNYIIFNNIKWVFVEAPGSDKYTKTRNKIISSFNNAIDLCLFIENDKKWEKKDYYINYLKENDIPYLTINIYSENNVFPSYNCKNLINKNDFFMNIQPFCKLIKNSKLEFVILQSFIIDHIGVILIGILKAGTFIQNKKYYLHLKKEIKEVTIKTLHIDGKPFTKITGPKMISICIDKIQSKEKIIGKITNYLAA